MAIERKTGAALQLPEPQREGKVSLEAAFELRQSIRQFRTEELELSQLSQLLWSAQGMRPAADRRLAPSAGARYPLELYTASAAGVYHYLPQPHALRLKQPEDLRPQLCAACHTQEFILQAPLSIILTAVFGRVQERYGMARGARYVHFEVGHAAQNILLQAAALGLGSVPVGAFIDAEIQGAIGAPAEHQPLYLLCIGYPA